jgi:hypothetical protein
MRPLASRRRTGLRCARAHAGLLLPMLLALGCGTDPTDPPDAATCLEGLALDCTPAYVPTYDAIFADVFVRSCGSASTGGSCHYGPDPAQAQGGLPLSDPDTAYMALMGTLDGRARVLPREPECSILVQRLESDDAAFRMPVGNNPLPESTRCAVRQWIAMGAQR